MPEFWENDAVANSDSEWWKQDSVKSPTVVAEPAPAAPFVMPEDPRGRNEMAPNPAWEGVKLVDSPLDITKGLPFHKLAVSAETVRDAWDVLKAMQERSGRTMQERLEGTNTPPTTGAKITAGAVAAGLTVPETMTSPLGIATLGAGAAGATAARVVSGAFAADMLKNTPEQVVDVYEAFKLDLGPEEATKRIGALTLNTAMLAATAKHAVTKSAVPVVKESLTSEPRVFYDEAVNAYTAVQFHEKFGNMNGTGNTAETAISSLNKNIENAIRHGTWRSVEHPEPVSAKNAQTESEVKMGDVIAPLEVAAVKAESAGAPATAEAVRQQAGIEIELIPKEKIETKVAEPLIVEPAFASRFDRETLLSRPAWVEVGSAFDKALGKVRSNPDKGVDITGMWKTLQPEQRQELIARGWTVRDTRKPGQVVLGLSNDAIAARKYFAAQTQRALSPPAAEPASMPPVADVTADISATRLQTAAAVETSGAGPGKRPLGEFYSEPMAERIRRLGGPVSAKVADEALQIVDHAKRLYGELSTRVLDDAKQSAGKAFRGGTTWIQGTTPVTERAATSRFHEILEERVRTGNFNHVPAQYMPLVQKLWDANLEIGRLAQQANPQFVATGKVQRMLTSYGHDIVMRGKGKAWEAWAEGLAAANGKTTGQVKHFLRAWKAEMDKPGADAAGINRISQDFVRQFPKVVTHIKPLMGWHEVVHSSPFSYLEQAAQRTANAVAFRQVHPVGSGSLEATRKAVQAELQTDTAGKLFDDTMRALQGHPTDQFTGVWNAPDTVIGATMRGTQIATKPLRSAMLTASLPTNIGESLSGGAQIFLGYGNAIRGAIRSRTMYRDLERSGMVNKAIRDFSFDPNQPLRSVSRYAGNLISRVFMNDFANEFQEYTGAATARLIADEVRGGTIDPATKTKLVNTMRAMGITKENARSSADGTNPEVLNQFETKAAEFLSAGSQATGEKSTLGASRAFNELFWFHSYPMSKVRQTRSVMNNIIEDATAKDWASAYQNSKLLGRVLGGTALGGAITIGTLTLLREGLFGVEIKKNEAQDDFGDFAKESFLMGFGGPLSIANRIWEQGGGIDEAAGGLVMASAPLSLAKELSDAATGSGRYEGMTPVETVGELLQSKTPGLKPFKYGMAVWGLSQDDPEFDAAARAFYKWRNDKFGSVKYKSNLKEDKERKEFRGHMKQAVTALKDGDMDKFEARVGKAADVAKSNKAIKQSFESRKLLRTPNGKAIDGEELEELRDRIGDKAVEKLLGFDAMLESFSR